MTTIYLIVAVARTSGGHGDPGTAIIELVDTKSGGWGTDLKNCKAYLTEADAQKVIDDAPYKYGWKVVPLEVA